MPELLPPEAAKAANYKLDQTAPVARIDDLADYDAIVVGTGTRFGRMSSQMASFLDQTGGLSAKGALNGKIGGAFASSATQHGGQEPTLFTIITLLHFGMTVIGLDYGFAGQIKLTRSPAVHRTAPRRSPGPTRSGNRARTSSLEPATKDASSHKPPPNSTAERREQDWKGVSASSAQPSGTGADTVEEKTQDRDSMQPAERDLLGDLRRARRSLRRQAMDEPPTPMGLTPGQKVADAVATVMGSWSFIIVQSAILFV